MSSPKILIGCEESQTVALAFRKLGYEAYSCDIQPCSGGHPDIHIQGDIFEAINSRKWDLGIFHPPCTYLTVAANRWHKPEYRGRFPDREQQRAEAIIFFKRLYNCNIQRICIENPIGVINSIINHSQIIQPYYFGDPERKPTCLWLKNLPPLQHSNGDLFSEKTHVKPEIIYHKSGRTDGKLHFETLNLPAKERSKARSKTFQGIADAMANQWSKIL